MDWAAAVVIIVFIVMLAFVVIAAMAEQTKRLNHQRTLEKPPLTFVEMLGGAKPKENDPK